MENRSGPWGQESTDDDDDSTESSPVRRSAELRLPRLPLREATPAAVQESRSLGFAAFMEQQRRAEEARRVAEAAAKAKETDDSDEGDQKSPTVLAAEHASSEVPTVEAVSANRRVAEQDAPELADVPAQAVPDAALEPSTESVDAVLRNASFTPEASSEQPTPQDSADQEQHIDPAALEQLQREAEEYANALLSDTELAPAISEPGIETDQPGALEPADVDTDAATKPGTLELGPEDGTEGQHDPFAALTSALPRQRTASPSAFSPAPTVPPPLAPMPGPRAGGTAGGGGYGGGFGPSSPGMGPSGPNALGGAAGLAGNLLHSHEHWHPKTFFALAGAILVSDMLGRSRDRKITRELRERTNKLKQIIDQHTGESEQQYAHSKRQVAEMQESYEDSRQKLASRLERVESQRAATEAQPAQQQEQGVAATAPTVESLLRMNQQTAYVERGTMPTGERFMHTAGSSPVAAAERGMSALFGTPESQPRGPIMPEIVPDTDRFAELQARPDMVMEQVAQAAEVGVSTEKVYERRQEVRDEASVSSGSQGGGAAAGNDTYASGFGYQPTSAGSNQFADTQAQMAQGRSYQKPGSDMYHQAMRAGFWAGIVVIALALIAVFVL